MAKRKKKRKPDFRTTIKLPDDIADAVQAIQRATGWTYGAAVGFLARAGVDLIYGTGQVQGPMREVLSLATATHLAEQSAALTVSTSRAKLRDATRRMKEVGINPEDLPELPAPGEPAGEPRRRPGRPRKHSPVPPHVPSHAHAPAREGGGILARELAETAERATENPRMAGKAG